MKKILFLFFLFIFLTNSSFLFADIEKGKWNFVKDTDYCYIGSSPEEEDIPEGKQRGDAYILVYRINKNPESIIQINAGYPYKKDEKVLVKIDKKDYDFFSDEDSAWTNDDDSVIYAMKKGIKLIVTGVSTRGTKTVDTYTLTGFTAAYNKLTKDC